MKKTTLALIISFAVWVLNAQEKQLSLYDAVLNPTLKTERMVQVDWIKGTNTVFYILPSKKTQIYFYDVDSKTIDSSFGLSQLIDGTASTLGDTLKSIPKLQFKDKNTLTFNHKSTQYQYQISSKITTKIITFPKTETMDWHEKSNHVAYINKSNLFIQSGNDTAIQITKNGGKGIVYGQAVHRNEFGINGGLFWSPSGNKLAFYRMDETMVTDYPIYTLNDTPAKIRNIKYPLAGAKSHHVTVGVYDMETKKLVYLKTKGDPEAYLTNIAWDTEEEDVILAKLNRAQNTMQLQEYDADNGALDETYFTEKNSKYVEPENPVLFQEGDKECYFWQSERDGYNHIYLYKEGKLKKQITAGNWMVTGIAGQNTENLFYTSTAASHLESNYYMVELSSGKSNRITKDPGTHYCIPNHDFSLWIDMYSSTEVPYKTQIIDVKGEVKSLLLESKNPLAEYNLGETKLFNIKNGNTELQARIILPPNFDQTKKYPLITYVYGGPHAQMITNTYLGGANYWMQMMAQKGYIIFTLDNRGSKNKGFDFESAIHANGGDIELEDQIIGMKFLKSLAYVDTTRMGVHGWSFGGFMTTSLMTRYPDSYKVGVAGGPVIDWKFYEIMYTERYMDSPKENAAGYDKSSLFQYIDNLKGRLLMIHGTDDDVVLWQHSLLYVKAAVDANNLNLDYFVYPGHPHNVMGKDRLHLMGKITQYFDDHL